MFARQNQALEDLIQRVTLLIQEKLPESEASQISSFAKLLFSSASPEDILEREDIDLYGALVSFWNFLQHRKQGAPKIRVYNPQFEQHGWQSKHTVIEIVNENYPFLLESVRMILNRLNLNVHLILHVSSLQVKRDSQGNLIEFKTKNGHVEDYISEMPIFIEIDKQSDKAFLEELERKLEKTIFDVKLAVVDWKSMRQVMSDVIETVETEFSKDKSSELHDEIIAFLKWINDDHFTYLGYCKRKLVSTENSYKWEIDEKTSLGIIREAKEKYFELFESMGEVAQQMALSGRTIILGKTNHISTVHRPAYTDFIVVKCFDKKHKVIGEHHFIGLYTSAAYNLSPQDIPLLRLTIKRVLGLAKVSPDSHDGKALINILENLPRDDFFHATVEEIYDLVMGILHLYERQRIRLFIRKDPYARTYSCFVFVPRERFNSKLREKMQNILMEELGGYEVDFETRFSESILARIHFIVRYKDDTVKEFNVTDIQNKLVEVSRTWEDNLKAALIEYFGEEQGNHLYCKYNHAFPVGYRSDFNVRTAVYDINHMEKLSQENQLEMSFYRPIDEPEGVLRFKLYCPDTSIPLSDVLPVLECMGLKVISERPHEVTATNGKKVWINDFGMVHNSRQELDVDEVKEIFQEAFYHIWYKEAERDGFNRLVLEAKLDWREVSMLRAYVKYLWQTGFTFSQAYIEEVMVGVPEITRDLVDLFKSRFNPKFSQEKRNNVSKTLRLKIKNSLEEVKNIDEDRIIRRYLQVILATLRTNFFQKGDRGEFKKYISFKFDPAAIPELPLPHPLFEIFVYSPRVEGVHLRGAKVARGGIRWSDRKEDFRTEVLGLMKAQQVKNAVIVPLGAKGGFVSKVLPHNGARDEIQAEGIACYQIFIRGMLDITDNLIDGQVIPPDNVVRYDSDDTYLVVAADKGTASFSDIANALSKEYNFWLGDAFASGGSTGYDHKKMGITARGTWESVKLHFRELDIDTQKTDFTVVGIGDMSGDVFGNGMLLSKHIKLVGAFNHIHIFLDPNPSPLVSFEERLRLFKLPRSTWEDYDKTLISPGGGVFSRSTKYIPISEEMQQVLGVSKNKMVPNELIRALLKANVDLLFNGGIGTYVKASFEHNANVGDRANDVLRINGNELHCKIVAEGGNLGFTQLGRIEYALNGGKINTDAIDNSGGVDCSDHEVNIKILLDGVVRSGDLTVKQRNVLLVDMTEEVAELVLENNRNQTEAISVAVANSIQNAQMHCRLIEHLELNSNLDRDLEKLPTNEELLLRQQHDKGLTRPEIAVLLAYSKTMLKSEILASDVPEDHHIAKDLITAFPEVLQNRYQKEMFEHSLKREIIATQITNSIFNDMGLGFIHRLEDETGATMSDIVRSYTATREIFHAAAFREAVDALDLIVSCDIQTKMLHELNRLVRRGTRWFLRHRLSMMDIEAFVNQFRPKMQQVREGLQHALKGTQEEYLKVFAKELIDEKVPEEIAILTAHMSAMFSALDIIDAANTYNLSVESFTITYYAVGARLELGWLREQIKLHPVSNHWDSLARAALRDDLDKQQRNLTVAIMLLQANGADVEAQIDAWMAKHKVMIERWKKIIEELKTISKKEYIMYSVAIRELTELANVSILECQQQHKYMG